MADRTIEGRIVFTGTNNGIKDLEVVAVDLDLFFSEDELGSALTNGNGDFKITYSQSRYDDWLPGRNPDIVVRVKAPGRRQLHETSEQSNVAVPALKIATIELHRANVEGWLVTNATLDPTNPKLDSAGVPVTWTSGNRVEILKDGETLFPQLTDAIGKANQSIRFINMNFWLGANLITKFPPKNDPTHPFDPLNPKIGVPVVGERFHEILKTRAIAKKLSSTNVLVQDIPFIDQIPVIPYLLRRLKDIDTADEVTEFFRGSPVAVRLLSVLSLSNLPTFMHAKAVVIDGTTAFVLGSTFARSYFGAEDHLINDARHGEKLIHDVSLKVEGPAVEQIDRSFTTLWNAADSSASALSPAPPQAAVVQPGLGVQVVRTLPGGTFTSSHTGSVDLPHGETGILEAYQRAIANATRFVYLEDQYFTAPEIFQALLQRMVQASNLEVVIVMNTKPDVSGYPEKQIQLFKQFQDELVTQLMKKLGLTKGLAEAQVKKRLGMFTLWSCNEQKRKYEIMPIYVHAKVAIVDDIWATIGSANLDGASLNQIQLDTIVQGFLASLVETGKLGWKILAGVILTIAAPLVFLTVWATKLGLSRPTQHANPGQSRQPTRSTELNVVICEKAPDPTLPNAAVVDFREALWREHLGMASLPNPVSGWVDVWANRAGEKLKNLQQDPKIAVPLRKKHPAKILSWVPQIDSGKYLRALGIATLDLNIRSKADDFDFQKGQWEK
jgi:phosphatidylserine/phosphatidylglycerophosphate/cardiolipin synthase-like enzyme